MNTRYRARCTFSLTSCRIEYWGKQAVLWTDLFYTVPLCLFYLYLPTSQIKPNVPLLLLCTRSVCLVLILSFSPFSIITLCLCYWHHLFWDTTMYTTLHPLSSYSSDNIHLILSKSRFAHHLEQSLWSWPQRCRSLSLQLPLYVATSIDSQFYVIVSAIYVDFHFHSCHSSHSCFSWLFPVLLLYKIGNTLPNILLHLLSKLFALLFIILPSVS